ncbi:MAG: Lrp/AsnC family transcriptional regulator [Muribaculaceae bacterium]|nr:Lrp/AsnC family transcriptional regulator [Muribaculaceae bacterium]
MPRQYFDKLDLTILHALADNARTPYLEIARDYGVSGAAVHQRVQRLMANKVIIGSHCNLNPEALGFNTMAYVGINLQPDADFDNVLEGLKKIPEVTECHLVTGPYDLLLRLEAKDNEHLFQLVQRKLRPLGLARTETLLSFREVFKRPLPITNE